MRDCSGWLGEGWARRGLGRSLMVVKKGGGLDWVVEDRRMNNWGWG
jgi:hypothetical protein